MKYLTSWCPCTVLLWDICVQCGAQVQRIKYAYAYQYKFELVILVRAHARHNRGLISFEIFNALPPARPSSTPKRQVILNTPFTSTQTYQ